ncbi:ABCAC protein, partial [Chordeiles acutipennis]|nr:ABCAC protein [Chordeiles acutipennis]
VWSFILISWPVVVFIILAIIRLKFPPEPQPNCYLAPRNLPSAGFFPFLQTVLCDSDARCKATPYAPEDLLPRLNDISSLRLKRKSSSSTAKGNQPSPWSTEVPKSRNTSLAFGDLVSHGEKTLRNISSPSNLTSSSNMFNNFGKNQTQYSTAANLKVILCEVLSRYIARPSFTEGKMAANIHQTFCFTDSSLLESFTRELRSQLHQVQHKPQYQAAFVNEMVSFLMLVSQVQNDTSLWHLLLLVPDVFQGSMLPQDIIDFLQNASSVVLAAQNVSASFMTDDRFKTVQNGATDPSYSLNCLEQETLYNKTLPWPQSDQTLSPTSLITRFLSLEFENTVLQVTVNNSYNPYLMCLINATKVEDSKLAENITLLLKQTHLKKNPFMQNNTSEKHSTIPELLKLKISRLRDLTTLLCDYESFKSMQHICHLPNVSFGELCEQSQSHEHLLRTVELSNQVVNNVLSHRRISQELQNILIGDATNIQTQMKWLQENIPEIAFFQEIPQYMTILNSMLNITENLMDSSKQEKLRDVFKNVDQLKEDLKTTTVISTASIDALLEASLPENSSQLISQILQMESCSVHPADPQLQPVAEELCNLSLSERTHEMYILGVTLLRHLDIYNFLYKMFFPKELQKPVDKMLVFLTEMKYFRHQVESGVDPLLQAIHSLKTLRQSRNVPLTKALFKPNNFKVTHGTFKSMSKVLCNQEITPLFFESLLPDFGDPVSNSSSVEDVYVQKMMRKYGIPHDSTPFCLSFYLDLVKTPTGALIWSFLKPMVLGKILFTPDTIETRAIMGKSNATLKQMADLALKSQEWLDKSPVIMNSLTKLNQTVPLIKNTLQNPFVQVFIKLMVDLDAAELLSQINKLDNIRLELQNNTDIVDQLNTLATLAVNVSSCVSFNRIQAVRSLEEMEMVAKELFLKNELFASIIFKLPSSHSSPGHSVHGALTLPPVLNYTIRMSSRITQTTNRIRERIWTVGPHNSTSQSQIYSRAFIYIQDSIERAIIELQTGKKPQEIAVQVQAMPYPCYNKDMFLTSVTYSLPFALMAAWVLFIADFVKTLVQEKDLRLYEYMKMMGVNASSHFIAWFIECAIFLLITVTFLIVVLKVGNILPRTNTALLFLYLMDYSLSIIAMSYFISVFFNNTNIAALVGSLVYILTFFPFIVLLVIENHLSFSVKSLLSLLSPTAFSYASQYIARYEAQGIGLQWDNMYKSPMIGDNTSFGWMCWLILIDSLIYFILGWYIRNVFPGRYGMAAPWYFPLLPSYWVEYNGYLPFWSEKLRGLLFAKLMLKKEATLNNKICAPTPHLEPEPTDLTLGVSLHDITKIYGSKAAVNNLSLNFYEGNITSLLGHNGAGKTTTMCV